MGRFPVSRLNSSAATITTVSVQRWMISVPRRVLERFTIGLRTRPEKGDRLTAPDGPGDLGQGASGPGAGPLFPRVDPSVNALAISSHDFKGRAFATLDFFRKGGRLARFAPLMRIVKVSDETNSSVTGEEVRLRMASMASGVMGGSLRHLRDLFRDGTAVGLGDGQLLARYAA